MKVEVRERPRGIGSRLPRTRWMAVGYAVAAAVVVWVVAVPVAGAKLAVHAGNGVQHVGPVSVLLASLIVGLLAVGSAAALARLTSHGTRNWTVLAVVVWVLSLAGPTGAATVPAGVSLACMHLVVGGVLIAGIRNSARVDAR